MDFQYSEFILEVRFRPDPEIIDRLGEIVRILGSEMAVSEWKIDSARTDVYDKDEALRAFVSFRNFGLIIRRPTTDNYFADQACKLVRVLSEAEWLLEPLRVDRLGVRLRWASPTPDSFEGLLSKYTSRVAPVPPAVTTLLGGTLTDISAPIYVSTNLGTIHSTSGPMLQEQLTQFFPFVGRDSLPKVALYVDLDRWETPGQDRPAKDLIQRIRRFAEENVSVAKRFSAYVLDEV